MTVEIRAAEQRDIPAMAGMRGQTAAEVRFWAMRIEAYMQGTHSPQHALGPRALFVACMEDIPIGLVAGHRTRRYACDGELQWIDVAEKMRCRGIGRRLIGRMGAWFVEVGVRRVCVNVAQENAAARRLYAGSGGRPLHPGWMVWDDIGQATGTTPRGDRAGESL